jgi:two-component system chemotaxis response regulator CheB
MRSLNFETCEVTNGKEALQSLEKGPDFDVVTVNWLMPVMDGLEFVSAVRRDSRFRRLPLLMISCESDAQQVERAMNAGVNQYLVKPCTPKAVAAKLAEMGVLDKNELPPQESGSTVADATKSESSKIRILIIDDSSVVRRVVSKTLNESEDMEVVGAARDGVEGLEMITNLRPDVVLLDVDMPRMDGLETLREMRASQMQVPVLMFSSRTQRGAKIATDALLLGAKDFVFKPGGANMSDLEEGKRAIVDQIVPRIRSLKRRAPWSKVGTFGPGKTSASVRVDLVVVGASTGGPAALASLVADEHFRNSLHAPILIVQHMPEHFTKHLADRLAQDSGLDISEVEEGEILGAGMIRFAPGGRHAVVRCEQSKFVTMVHDEPPVNSCRPSVDVLFQSAASAAADHLLAIVLTGMGHDGREGCRRVRASGGRVIAQDEASSVVWGMPGSVVREALADSVMPIEKMGAQIAQRLRVARFGGGV